MSKLEEYKARLLKQGAVFLTTAVYKLNEQYFFIARQYGGYELISYGPYDSRDKAEFEETTADSLL